MTAKGEPQKRVETLDDWAADIEQFLRERTSREDAMLSQLSQIRARVDSLAGGYQASMKRLRNFSQALLSASLALREEVGETAAPLMYFFKTVDGLVDAFQPRTDNSHLYDALMTALETAESLQPGTIAAMEGRNAGLSFDYHRKAKQ